MHSLSGTHKHIQVIQTVISPSTFGLSTWNTTLQIKVVIYELSFSNSIQVWKDMWESKWWPDYSFKLFQSLLVFSNIQSFVKLMGKNNRVGGFSFFSNPSIFLLLPCMTLPEMDAKARQQCNEWWVEQNSSAVWLCVCVCARASVCVDICGEIVRQMELSACPLCTVEPLKPHADTCFIAAVCTNAALHLT